MSPNIPTLEKRLSSIISQQQTLLGAFNDALVKGDMAEQGRIQKDLARLGAELQRVSDEVRYAKLDQTTASVRSRARAPGKTIRELVLDTLDEFGVPLAPATVCEYSQIVTGIDLPVSRFASLRRDEERAARRDLNARPAWVAPALSTSTLRPMPRLLTSSAWELERRLVGARSLRVCHLKTTLAFVQRFERFKAVNAPHSPAVESLMLRYARGVPGAVLSGQRPDPEQIRKCVMSELDAIETDDLAERRQAAARLSRYGHQLQLWGLPEVIEGGPQSGSVAG